MKEAELQEALADAAKIGEWTRAHFRPARTLHGWRTPGMYEAAGWPDLALLRFSTMLCWELKSAKGVVSEDQMVWLEALDMVPGIDARVIRPTDLDWAIDRLISRRWRAKDQLRWERVRELDLEVEP